MVSYAYQGGAIGSDSTYRFGYIEIRAKFPTGYYSLWPAFWLQNSRCDGSPFYNEIDIAEGSADDNYSGSYMGTGYNSELDCSGQSNPSHAIQIPFSIAGWHKYALEWNESRLTWYFDDVAVRTYYDGTGVSIPQRHLTLYLDFAVYPWNAWNPKSFSPGYNWTYGEGNESSPTSYPQYFKIDYVRDYKLTKSNSGCTTVATNLCSLSSYYRKVYKSITTDNTCSPNINPSTWNSSYTLRATDYVLLDVPSGSNSITINPTGTGYFAIDVVPCPQ